MLTLYHNAISVCSQRLHRLTLGRFWEGSRPRVTDWFARIRSRPSFARSFEAWKPRDYDDLLRDRGADLWPQVAPLLERPAA